MSAETVPAKSPADELNKPEVAGAEESDEAPRRSSPWVALQYRDYRLIWGGGFVSQLGSQMRIVAVDVQLWDLTHNFTLVGLLGLFQMLPLLGFSLFGGVVADAFDRRRMMMITQTSFATSSLLLAVATGMGWASPWLIYGVAALGAATTAFDNPARSALIPSLVPRRHLPNALSLSIIMWQIATIGGPVLAGLLVATGTSGLTFIYSLDTISFTAVLISLFLLRTRPEKAASRDVSVRAALDGLRFLRRSPIIMSTMTLDFFATFFGAATVLLPAVAERVLMIDRSYLGALYSAPGVGALVAGLVMSWLGNVRNQGRIVIWSVVGYGIATLTFGLSQNLYITLLALAGTGAADTVSMVMRQTIRQLNTPDELRGRLTSVNMLFYIGGPRMGELEAGFAATAFGLGPSIAFGGIAVIIVTLAIGWLAPTLRNYDRLT
jgi:MFS family permease